MVYDCTVIGGGIVGLASAFRILEERPDANILILEKESEVALHQTGHNSGVIHSGIYYKPGSLKARNCLTGYEMMVEFARKYGIPFELCGKVIVATNQDEIPRLDALFQRGLENGLADIRMISSAELKEIEPHCPGKKAIHVPYTGIIDYKAVALKIAELIKISGGTILCNQKVTDIRSEEKGAIVVTQNQEYKTNLVINCAGLYSDKVAQFTEPDPGVKIIPFRGEYYEITENKRYLVKNLIYPVPDPAFPFLGVHFTRMVSGGVEAGPNAVFAFQREGYKRNSFKLSEFIDSVTWPGFLRVASKYWKTGAGEFYRSFSKSAFTRALQKLIPEIREEDLIPAEAGVRAQACDRNGGLVDDFIILEKKHAINVLNAPSPAATSSLSIGKTISDMVIKRF